MFFKLANTATLDQLSNQLDVNLVYPNLYKPEMVIDGLEEKNILIKKNNKPDRLYVAIWGILPKNFNKDWSDFQSLNNTLNFEINDVRDSRIFNEALIKRRCLIAVTGFYTSFVEENGDTLFYFVHLSKNRPFYLGGIYNILDDGFITCSLLVTKNSKMLKDVNNLGNTTPLLINPQDEEFWLDPDTNIAKLDEFLDEPKANILQFDKVKKNEKMTYSGNSSLNSFLA